MVKINLREHYPNFYKEDCIMEVPDEIAAIMLEYDRLEAAYRRRTYYHNAHYSLDRGDCHSAGQTGQADQRLLFHGA